MLLYNLQDIRKVKTYTFIYCIKKGMEHINCLNENWTIRFFLTFNIAIEKNTITLLDKIKHKLKQSIFNWY